MSKTPATSSSRAPRIPRVVALLMDGMWAHDLANVIQVFGNGVPLRGQAPCDLSFASAGRSASLDHGLSAATTPLVECDTIPDLVCVPGFVDPVAPYSQTRRTRQSHGYARQRTTGPRLPRWGQARLCWGRQAFSTVFAVRLTTRSGTSFACCIPPRCWTRTPSSHMTKPAASGPPLAGRLAWTCASRLSRIFLGPWLRHRLPRQ